MVELSALELADRLRGLFADEIADPPGAVVLVHVSGPAPVDLGELVARARTLPCVLVGSGDDDAVARWAPLLDVGAPENALDRMLAVASQNPIAATTLALLLRGGDGRSVLDAIVAESSSYSVLQAGPEFATWRAAHAIRERSDDAPTVRAERVGDELHVTLSRPAVHNALNSQMRDELTEALATAEADPSIDRVVLDGAGPSFCAGGDLDEFGSRPDPATAHLVRLARSPALALARLSPRLEAHIHGSCYGSGIELAAFARHVLAERNTAIALPEVAMGLIPGAGGTASLVRRIGRHRTALLALTTAPIDVETALAWGLVDEIVS